MYGTCQIARFAAQSEKATRGCSRVPRTVRTPVLRASGARMAAGRKKTSSGPRSAVTISAGARSPIRTCWVMWAEEQLLVGEVVERPDQREERHAEPGPEEHDAIPAGEVGTATPAQPHDRLEEEERRDGGAGMSSRNHASDCASDAREAGARTRGASR